MGTGNLNLQAGQYSVALGKVGGAIELTTSSTLIQAANLVADSVIAIEFYFKPGSKFSDAQLFTRNDNAISIGFSSQMINFRTKHTKFGGGVVSDNFDILLNGVSRKSFGYYADGNWHHLVFKFNAAAGTKELFVDGLLANGFSKTISGGTIANTNAAMSLNLVPSGIYRFYGFFDEIAFYNKNITPAFIYKHYLEGQQGLPYSFNNNYTQGIPTAPAVSAGIDVQEFAPGHPNVNVNFIDQLKGFPTPRFKRGHTMRENFQWMNPEFVSGRWQTNITYADAVANSLVIQKELAEVFNYALIVSENTGYYGDYNNLNSFPGAWVNLANQNPQLKAAAISFWPQLRPDLAGFTSGGPYGNSQNKPNTHYLRNSNGQYLNPNGGVGTFKYWSPASPLDSVAYDGLSQKFYIEQLLNKLTRPLNYLNENGEILPYYTAGLMQQDPAVVADKNSSGIIDWFEYYGDRAYRITNIYKSQFNNLLTQNNIFFSHYAVDGYNNYRAKYSEMRNIQSTRNGQKFPTPDFYPRFPSYYWDVPGAWHGLQWIFDCRINELAEGDNLYSPFVAAGWEEDETQNIRPGQWLGLMKILSVTGAEYFYTAFFNLQTSYNPPSVVPAHPNNYIWQEVIPPYAQAVTSRFESLFKNSYLMPGDETNKITNTLPGYRFKTGDARKVIVARKHNSQNQYLISGAIENNSNMMGSVEPEGPVTINLDGQQITLTIRRQGSTYFYDNTNTSAPIFYQIDGWHEYKHPSRWTTDFNIEAELFDNAPANANLKTTFVSNMQAGDFRNTYTTITYSNSVTVPSALEYDFAVRSTAKTYYLWVRARSKNGLPAGASFKIDNGQSRNIACITSTDFRWYRIDSASLAAIQYSNLAVGSHTFKISPYSNAFEIDKFVLTTNSNLGLDNIITSCGAQVNVTIASSLGTALCPGTNTTLTASAGQSFIWSNGATTSSINVSTPGTYIVTVTQNGSIGTATITIASTTPPATPVITTAVENGQIVLKAQQPLASGFLWNNGNTTNRVTVNATGIYTVSATGPGCTSLPGSINITSLLPCSCVAVDLINAYDITNASAVINFNACINADTFVVLYYADKTSSLLYKWASGNDHDIKLTGLSPNTLYRYSVISRCGAKQYYSSKGFFTTLPGNHTCRATPVSLSESQITINSARLNWFNTVADFFVVRYRVIGNSNYNTLIFPGSNLNFAQVNQLISNTNYEWEVRSICNGYWSPFGFTSYFKTLSNAANCATPINLANSTQTTTSLGLTWSNSINVDSVIIRYREEGTVPYKFKRIKGSPNPGSNLVNSLTQNTTYTFEIRYICNGQFSDYSNAISATTKSAGGKYAAQVSEETEHNSPITIYPNPVHGILNISFSCETESKISINIVDALGKQKYSHVQACSQGQNIVSTNVEGWSVGMYFVSYTINGMEYRAKLNVY
ncbi:MAG: T9SS type A sorting domain-containing protein [Bacteroidetes bacterium]|nr:T9SS type A sorting domain-containing protein [Bacteroidota bacterium]